MENNNLRRLLDDLLESFPLQEACQRTEDYRWKFLAQIGAAWEQCPEKRFGEFLSEVFYRKDMFPIEDANFIEEIETWVQLHTID